MSSRFYAVADANGPISVAINTRTAEQACKWFAKHDAAEFVDQGRTDAEDDFGAECEGMSKGLFFHVMRSNGYEVVELDMAGDYNWMLWARAED
jgi:hypothetical protein